ncbi:hypothetical protein GCM10007938_42980 [Vibrio zhanjiangensis]|uniref:Uncharacterized protein n=1 Tax=Vibrio zhanjiangensis TaxID=1046128 RepID=A0ABQ6F4P0_9VIBR|nr:hypothetical protein [Vibrio zhanjiangensis]GLT20513.1 hypothetical protein GCM10007938_42980 [Vibrio zhanjiangensis]
MKEVSLEKVVSTIRKVMDDSTSFNDFKYDSMESAISKLAKEKHQNINVFETLTQEMIEQQKEDYDGYLDGAKVGDLVWGDSEMWVSQLVVERWAQESSDAINNSDDIEQVADYVENCLIVEVLSASL